jgi:Putative MetA-pathway of phenol degradation
MRTSRCLRIAIAVLLFPLPLAAQSTEGLANLVPNLILRGIRLPGGDLPGTPHAGHFTLGDPTFGGSQAGSIPDPGAIGAVVSFGDRLRTQFANVPLGSSTGGFTYSFNEQSGIYTRNTESFGPAFTERAATIGRRKFSLGVNYQHTSFDTFGGEDLRDGSIIFYLPHTDCCVSPAAPPPSAQIPGFESDVMEASLRLKAKTETVAFFTNYGVTDRFDIGVAIPITHVSLDAEVNATILRLSSGDSPQVHTFTQGQNDSDQTFPDQGSATGIGDVVLRTKYNFLQSGATGLSLGVDVRLPTGDENDLLGIGTTQGKFFLIMSSNNNRLSPHVNVGFTLSGKGETPAQIEQLGLRGASHEFNYAGGVEVVAHPKVTIIGDLLGRTLIDAGKIELETKTFPFRPGAGANAAVPLQTSSTNPHTGGPYEQLALRSGALSLLLGAAGVKFNAATNLLLQANVLFPLNDAGLQDHLTVAFGFDYAF